VRTGVADRVAAYPCIDFFPATKPLLREHLPTARRVRAAFERAGLQTLDSALVTQQIAPTHAAFADKLAARGDSILAQLSSRDFDAGLSALRAHAETIDPRPVMEPVDYFVFG
jgi:hypothetical protein